MVDFIDWLGLGWGTKHFFVFSLSYLHFVYIPYTHMLFAPFNTFSYLSKKKKGNAYFFPNIWISKLHQSLHFRCKITSHFCWTNISQSTKSKSHNVLVVMIEISKYKLRFLQRSDDFFFLFDFVRISYQR